MDAVKRQLRAQLRSRRQSLPAGLRFLYSQRICRALGAHPLFLQSRCPAIHCGYGSEVSTLEFLASLQGAGRVFAIPRMLEDGGLEFYIPRLPVSEWRRSPRGIPEPDPERDEKIHVSGIDLVVLPGVGFDPHGNRLGQGKGCYDRFLASLPVAPPTIGIAYECQMAEAVPVSPTDIPVERVITERTEYHFQELEWLSESVEETHRIAGEIAACIVPPLFIGLSGELGAGKTEWTRGLLHALGWPGKVRSPTFALEHVYETGSGLMIYHLDGYRLDHPSLLDKNRLKEIEDSSNSIILLEWHERFGDAIPRFSPRLCLERRGENSRAILWNSCEEKHRLKLPSR